LQIEAACKAEIINIAEYLNTNYKPDQFVNIVKSSPPNMNSITKTPQRLQKNYVNAMRRVTLNRMEYNTQRQDWESP